MLHPNQTCRDEAKAELNARLALENKACELTQYLVWAKKNDAKSNTTRSLVVAGSAEIMDECIEQLLTFNDLLQEEKDLWPHTGHWFFVPFNPVGNITQEQINAMMEAQNYFLENQKSVAVTGFENIKHHVPDPANPQLDKEDKSMEGLDPPTILIN
eukprot:5765852-Ditylum_brightwellii.AAC.1